MRSISVLGRVWIGMAVLMLLGPVGSSAFAADLDELEALDEQAAAEPTEAKTLSMHPADETGLSELDAPDEASAGAAPAAPRGRSLILEPRTRYTVAGGKILFQASGGVAPYRYQVVTGDATIGEATGEFAAGSAVGTVIVRATDAIGRISDSAVSVQPPLDLKLVQNESPEGGFTFQATGGAPPLRYSIDSSGGMGSSARDANGNDRSQSFLVVRDSAGSMKRVAITLERIAPLLAVPEKPEINPEREVKIRAVGGQAPYRYEVSSGGGSIDAESGVYKAPSQSTEAALKVTDASGQSQLVQVRVANPRAPAGSLEAAILSPATTSASDRMVVGGAGHTCVLDRGELSCWGQNRFGELGDGTRERRLKPVKVPGFQGTVASVVAGYNHTCALTNQGRVFCWGDNRYGQLGDGTLNASSTPVQAPLPLPAITITAGQYHACAVLKDGTASCWGSNRRGQLGRGNYQPSGKPVAVRELAGAVRQIAAGAAHTCALLVTNRVQCWGYNSTGQLGEGTLTDRPLPSMVKNLDEVEAIAVGGFHACAKTKSGLRCWGSNEMGQLGDGTTLRRLLPVTATSVSGTIGALSAGFYHTCATLDGQAGVHCWGSNQSGQAGTGDETLRLSKASAVRGFSGTVSALGCGVDHTCALSEDGLRCWGSNAHGQFGNRTLETSRAPASDAVPLTPAL